ncbi:site-2 protease family protein [Rhodovulum adriaticum]|uniref:Zinc metalloprotease n=1 Tax=Rhodovulum adriaticum TaxID=35804 RepID=A0A4R2NTT6_RHOAD|nr:site-2 protease family protein [Rhodovulum adriaticum]MBK1635083.1 site-2 protease family protein [Rhodovulum adriaticum]TCP25282.1 Zn-dependent protease [Rhodovulum adriaticum]
MVWSFSIGRLLGSELRIHATFFLLLAWIAVAAWMQAGPLAALINVVFVLALFACVVAHEFGHALMARRFGIATPDITLLPIGGLARLERMPKRPAQEIAVAVAGPAVNVAIWAVLIALGAETDLDRLATIEDPAAGFWGKLAAINLFLVLFNMIPAFPMDGGRVFRAVLSMGMGRVAATRLAARGGQALAFLFGFLGLTWASPVLVLIAVFVFLAAGAESADVSLRDMSRHLRARDAMITQFESLAPSDRLQVASNAVIRTTQHEFPVIDGGGGLRGFLTRNALFAALAEGSDSRPVAEAMTEGIPTVPLSAPLDAALDALQDSGAPAVAVTEPSGRMVGYITRENIGELMVISGRDARRV